MKFLRLKKEYIIQQSISTNLLVDTENQRHVIISKLETLLFGYMNGLYNENEIIQDIIEKTKANKDKVIIIRNNLKNFLVKFDKYIDYTDISMQRNDIFWGDKNGIYPYIVSVEVTNKCLLKCIHCYKSSSFECNEFIEYSQLISYLNHLVGKTHHIQLTGGEVMLHPNFYELLEFCKNNFSKVSISTTGILVDKDNLDHFVGCNLYLSLYGNNASTNQQITTIDAFDKIIKVLKLLIMKGIHTCVNLIATNSNIDEIAKIIELCEIIGVNGIGIGSIVKVGRAVCLDSSFYLDDNSLKRIEKMKDKYETENMYISIPSNSTPTNLHCGLYKWIVNEKGFVLPCAFISDEVFNFGNIYSGFHLINEMDRDKMKKSYLKYTKELLAKGFDISKICPCLKIFED